MLDLPNIGAINLNKSFNSEWYRLRSQSLFSMTDYHSWSWHSTFPLEISFSFSTLKKRLLSVSFSISTLSLLTLAEVWQAGHVLIPKICDFMIWLTYSMQFVDFRQIPSCGCVHCCWHPQCEQSNVVLFQFLWKSMAPNLWVGRRHNYCTFCFLHEFNWSHNINQT